MLLICLQVSCQFYDEIMGLPVDFNEPIDNTPQLIKANVNGGITYASMPVHILPALGLPTTT